MRSIAHLKMLQSLSGKLSRLNDVAQIGLTIADELRLLIDYHNCRVFLRDGDELLPARISWGLDGGRSPGRLSSFFPPVVGRGITGRVAETGESLLVPRASHHESGEQIAGTVEIEESLLAVPLKFGARVIGVIVISKLGLNQFDADDLRVLEVLAGHASVALENARLYEAQRREAESAKALLSFGREVAEAKGITEVAERVVAGSVRILSSPSASIWLQDSANGDLTRLAVAPDDPPTDPARSRSCPGGAPRALAQRGPSRTSSKLPITLRSHLRHREPTVVSRSHHSSSRGAGAPSRPPFRPRTILGDRELEVLGGLARQTQLALQSAASYATLERTFLSTVEALANALEANDEYTSTHARWITDLALKVGEELGLEAEELKRLELGALFHDIGKIGIPSRILTKPGPLTEQERRMVETHPVLGERILAPIEQLGEVRRIVRSAHEHYDGSGYPDGLAGGEIPLESRIVLACDAFHAMTTDRPYRKALGVEEARRRLVEASGSQFDPQIVDALLRVLGD